MESEPANQIGAFLSVVICAFLIKNLEAPLIEIYNTDICIFQVYLFQFPGKITEGL